MAQSSHQCRLVNQFPGIILADQYVAYYASFDLTEPLLKSVFSAVDLYTQFVSKMTSISIIHKSQSHAFVSLKHASHVHVLSILKFTYKL